MQVLNPSPKFPALARLVKHSTALLDCLRIMRPMRSISMESLHLVGQILRRADVSSHEGIQKCAGMDG